ncbi:efflux RND transporter permease subunit [Paenibacillus chitinolyticus]
MQKWFDKFGDFIIRRSKQIIITVLVLTLFFSFGLSKLELKMGNDVFVDSQSEIYKNTAVYQKNFGGDGIYLLISGDRDDLISQATAREIVRFTEEALKIKEITGTTNYISLMNELLSSNNPSMMFSDKSSSSDLETALMNAISDNDKKNIETSMKESLTEDQIQKIQAYTQKQLSPEQLQQLNTEMAKLKHPPTANQQSEIMQSILTKEQHDAIESYTKQNLTENQQKLIQKQVIKALPAVQDMSDDLLRKIVFSNHGKVPSQLEQLIPQNGKHILIELGTSDNTDISTYVRINEELRTLINESHFGVNLTIRTAGVPVVLGDVQGEVISTMVLMLSLAIVLMIVVLFVVFPVRRRIISLGFVLIGLIWTFGFMGWTGIPITLATMATLPIIIGLGTDFGVQFHNRYEEEYRLHNYDGDTAVKQAIKHMGPAVGIAAIIMALSFLTMYLSKAPMMQQFGLTLALGVLFCYFVEFLLMFSTFKLLDHKRKHVKLKLKEDDWLSRFLGNYAGWVSKVALPILAISIVLSASGFSVEHKIPAESNIMKMIPQDMNALKDTSYLQEVVGSTTYITLLVEANDITEPDVMNWMYEFGTKVEKQYREVTAVTTLPSLLLQLSGTDSLPKEQAQVKEAVSNLPASIAEKVISKNHQYATIQFAVNPNLSSADQFGLMKKITDDIKAPDGIRVNPAGAQVMMLYGIDNIGANSTLMKVAGLVIILIGLLAAYRRIKHAIFPLIPIILVLGFSPGTLKLLSMSYNPLTTALSCLVLGIGTEFTILIMERFREEEAKGLDSREAIKVSLSKVGQAITASGLTVIAGFSTLIFVSFPVLRDFGITTVIDMLYSLISALTILPVLVVLFRRRNKEKDKNRG